MRDHKPKLNPEP